MTTHETKKTCAACLQEIPKKAVKCSHCGKRQNIPPCCAVPLVIFLVFLLFGVLGSALEGPDGREPSYTQEFETEATDSQAFSMAKRFVETTLMSPSTANFPSGMFDENYAVVQDGDVYAVTSYVDAQNGFGATIRTYYTISLRFLGGDPYEISAWEYIDMQTE